MKSTTLKLYIEEGFWWCEVHNSHFSDEIGLRCCAHDRDEAAELVIKQLRTASRNRIRYA